MTKSVSGSRWLLLIVFSLMTCEKYRMVCEISRSVEPPAQGRQDLDIRIVLSGLFIPASFNALWLPSHNGELPVFLQPQKLPQRSQRSQLVV